MPTVRVDVTLADIALGAPRKPWCCPVALASLRAVQAVLPDVHGVCVGLMDEGETSARLRICRSDGPTLVSRVERVGSLIGEYDLTHKMQPFAFDLVIPEEACPRKD